MFCHVPHGKLRAKIMKFFSSFTVGLLFALMTASAFAGQYSQNFSTNSVGQTNFNDGSLLVSSAPSNTVARVEDAGLLELQLSQSDIAGTRSAFLLPDLDPTNRISAFSASWVSPVYGNFPNAGDGFAFTFGPVRALNLTTNISPGLEFGYGVGLTVSMHTGNSVTPGLRVFVNGVKVAGPVVLNPAGTWGNFSSTRHTFQVSWFTNSGVSVWMDGAQLFTNVAVAGFTPAAGDSFVWAARSGTSFGETFRVDNLNVFTTTGTGDSLTLQSATAANVPVMPQVSIGAQVNPNGFATTVIAEFGTNTAYGTRATNLLTAPGFQSVTNLFPFGAERTATLHARITASNALGTATSGDLTFSSLFFEKKYSSDFIYTDAIHSLALPATSAAAWLDFNNDGWLDFTIVGLLRDDTSRSLMYYNSGTNQTTWSRFIAPNGFRANVAVGDFDNDNRPDAFYAVGQDYYYNPLNPGIYSPSGPYGPGLTSAILFGSDTTISNILLLSPRTNVCLFPGLTLENAQIAVGDFDRDGQQEVFLSGLVIPFGSNSPPSNPNSALGGFSWILQNKSSWLRTTNNGTSFPTNSTMQFVNTALPSLAEWRGGAYGGQAAIAVGDLDHDGFDDAFCINFIPFGISGQGNYPAYYGFYHGDGDMGFTRKSQFRLYPDLGVSAPYVDAASCVLADFDGDGNLDVLFGYVDEDWSTTKVSIWLNDGYGNFTDSHIVLPPLLFGNYAAGDVFNHGRNDIVMVGYLNQNSNIYQTVVLRNDGGGIFTPVILGNVGCIDGMGKGVQLADYDNDGRLDFLMSGDALFSYPLNHDFSGIDPATHIFRNVMNIPSNAPPAAPPGLAATVGAGTVTFRWGNATDDITPANLLTYNLRVGTNSLGTQTVSPLANVTTGWRKIVAPGNCGHATNILYRFPPGTYYWSMQAVDGAFAGGAWAAEQTFTITNAEPVRLALNGTNGSRTLTWPLRHQGFTLDQKTTLTNVDWVSNSTPVGTLNGQLNRTVNGQWSVPVTNNAPSSFYRLRK